MDRRGRNLLVVNKGELKNLLFSRISITMSTKRWRQSIYDEKKARETANINNLNLERLWFYALAVKRELRSIAFYVLLPFQVKLRAKSIWFVLVLEREAS